MLQDSVLVINLIIVTLFFKMFTLSYFFLYCVCIISETINFHYLQINISIRQKFLLLLYKAKGCVSPPSWPRNCTKLICENFANFVFHLLFWVHPILMQFFHFSKTILKLTLIVIIDFKNYIKFHVNLFIS